MSKCRVCNNERYKEYGLCYEHYRKRKNAYLKEKRRLAKIKDGMSACKVNVKRKRSMNDEDSIDFWNINGDAIFC